MIHAAPIGARRNAPLIVQNLWTMREFLWIVKENYLKGP
jgi:hypothetical protein